MKKLHSILLAGAVLFGTLGASAQTIEQRLIEPERTVFAPHWFMQVQGGAAETLGEASFGDLISPAAALNIGYKFNPLFGLRAGASGWQAKGAVLMDEAHHIYKFNYIQANVDAMLSLTNLFCGWNPKRVLDFYAFVGVGGTDRFHNDEALKYAAQGYPFRYLWDTHKWSFTGRGGLGVNIRLSDIVAINVEANANGTTDHFNSKHGKDSNIDWQFNGLVGLTFNFGKSYKTIPAVFEEIIIEPEPLPEPEPEPAPAPKPAPVIKAEPMTQNVFFLINSYKIRPAEQVKIDKLVEYMKANPKTVVTVTGYADKETGYPAYNMALSQKRSAAVAAVLEAAGINASRITTKAEGDTVQPFPVSEYRKNRVAICIAEED